jgi:hypothetical protein
VNAKDYADCETSREPDDICAICKLDFDNTNPCFKLRPCRYQYHEECIEEWLNTIKTQKNITCPLCGGIICEGFPGPEVPEGHSITYQETLAITPPWANPEWCVTVTIPYKLERQGRWDAFFELYDSLEWIQSSSESDSDGDAEAQASLDLAARNLAELSLEHNEE